MTDLSLAPANTPTGPSEVTKGEPLYINFCRVTATPEELILDFGVQTELEGTQQNPVRAPQRVLLGLYTAKRLLATLQTTLERYEAVFGNVDASVENRLAGHHPRP